MNRVPIVSTTGAIRDLQIEVDQLKFRVKELEQLIKGDGK